MYLQASGNALQLRSFFAGFKGVHTAPNQKGRQEGKRNILLRIPKTSFAHMGHPVVVFGGISMCSICVEGFAVPCRCR